VALDDDAPKPEQRRAVVAAVIDAPLAGTVSDATSGSEQQVDLLL